MRHAVIVTTRLHKLIAAAALALLLAAAPAARAQHEGHDQHTGHKTAAKPARRAPKRKPKPKPTARKKSSRNVARKPAASPSPRQPDTHAGHDMTQPAAAPASSPGTNPTPAASPTPSHAGAHEGHVSPMQTPAPSQAAPATVAPAQQQQPQSEHTQHQMPAEGKKETPAATPTPSTADPHAGHDMKSGHEGMKMPGEATTKPAGVGGIASISESDVNELMVMRGDEMGIRVGASQNNFMSMGQMGSGTAWQPSSAQMNMIHKREGDWLLMFHYNVVAGVNRQGGPRGVTKLDSANWFMPMAYRRVGRGTLQLRGMFSLEPFTFPPGGSPLLFQTGETYKGEPLIDKQHPHDLFMEISAQYTLPIGERGTWFAYFGYPGEPALGPVAFMHRASASENPSATLSHHLQDSTHISFGVLTTGFT
ncbi:MAG: hypothetical protein ABR554_16290 [Pyrinomonadaceae bacterium]